MWLVLYGNTIGLHAILLPAVSLSELGGNLYCGIGLCIKNFSVHAKITQFHGTHGFVFGKMYSVFVFSSGCVGSESGGIRYDSTAISD